LKAGADILFAPSDAGMYPSGEGLEFSTWVVEERLAREMEGRSRPQHFRGVTTVVAKLLNIVQPDLAVFGAKDYQQAAIIQRMVRDLNFPVKVLVGPTLRERDGLAMSSRNRYLTGRLRSQATVLSSALRMARTLVRRARRPLHASGLKTELERWIQQQPDARVDYIAFFDPATLQPVRQVGRGTHLALAAFVGKTRLIDNARL
jgi:pantoate--beta-alanine ligase